MREPEPGYEFVVDPKRVDIACNGTVVWGDVKVVITKKDQSKVCHFWFNTFLAQQPSLTVLKAEIDDAERYARRTVDQAVSHVARKSRTR